MLEISILSILNYNIKANHYKKNNLPVMEAHNESEAKLCWLLNPNHANIYVKIRKRLAVSNGINTGQWVDS